MLKKKAYKIIVFCMVLVTVINVSVSFETSQNGHFLQVGVEADAAINHFYDKYDIGYVYTEKLLTLDLLSRLSNGISVWSSIEFSTLTGYHGTGTQHTAREVMNTNGYYYYVSSPNCVYYYRDNGLYSSEYVSCHEVKRLEASISKGPTIFLGSVQATDSTYPENGKHTDGYWYIKKGTKKELITTFLSDNNPFPLGSFIVDNSRYTYSISYVDYKYAPEAYTNVSMNGILYKIFEGQEALLSLPDGQNNYQQLSFNSSSVGITSIYRTIKNSNPTIFIQKPSQTETLTELNTFTPSMTVSDPDGDTLTCKYYIDSVEKGTKTISNTATDPGQTVNFDAMNIKILKEGKRTLRFEVSDGIADLVSQSVDVIVDNQPPVISGENFTSEDTSITISGTATDTISDSGSLQYMYTIKNVDGVTVGDVSPNWANNNVQIISALLPDTIYTAKFEVKDKVGHVTSIEKTINTKAQTPQINANNIQKNSIDLYINDSNPSTTKYQIMVGSSYVTATGSLSSSSQWITPYNKKITITGLSPNTQYVFTAKAKNGEGIETTSTQIFCTTLALPPANIHVEEKGINSLKISWDAVSNAIGYYVIADGKQPSDLDLVTSTEYTHSGLIAETNHSYSVSVKNAGGTGTYSFPDLIGMTLPNPPEAPVITDTSTTYTAITINWDAVAKADGYEIEADGKIIPTDSYTTYKDDGLLPDSLHKYRVRSKNTGGPSDWSALTEISTMPTPPEIPENLKGMPSRTNITLTWDAAPRAEKYVIDLDGKSLEVGSATSYIHEGLAPNTNYTYKIKAWNKGGESKWSSPKTITTWPEIPVAPTNIMATAERDAITVTWYSTPFAESYDLQVDGTEIVNVKETSFTDKGLTDGTKHTYKIRSKNISGEGQWSNLLEISTLPKADITTTEAMLANIVAVVTNKAVTLAWQAVAVNAQYEVEVDGVLSDNGKETVYNHTGLKPLSFHTYRIRTKDANENGQWCAVLALSTLPNIPGAPSGVNAIAANTQIELRWNKEEETGYDVEVDGKVVDAGVAAKYIDDELNPGTAHTYRVRGKNVTGFTAWSDSITKSTISPAYEVDCIKGQEFKFSLLASNVQEFGEMTFVVTYNSEEIEVADLCEYTAATDVINSGMIPGTNITVKYTAGRIEFTVNESIIAGTTWSGEITTILFKPKLDGKTSIEFNIE